MGKGVRQIQRHVIKHLYNDKVKTRVISFCVACHVSTARFWINRDGVRDMPRTGRPEVYSQQTRLSLVGFYCQSTPFSGCGRWTLRLAERYLEKHTDAIGAGISKSSIHKILQANNLKPHRSKYFLHISDPDFFQKMDRLICLYSNPPENLYCFDECPGIQVLQRLSPDLRTGQMKMRLEEFEYIRNGTVDVFAFYSVNTGKVHVECRPDHTKKTMLEVFGNHLETAPKEKPLNYIMDNLTSHCSYELCALVAKHSNVDCPPERELNTMIKRREWLTERNRRIVFHYTPFHGSWLNQVEIWFGILNAKCLRETFNSPDAMRKAIYEFQELWNTLLAKPINWEYKGEGLHEKAVKRFSEMLNSPGEMDVRFTAKQLNLMANIVNDCWNEVPTPVWDDLNNKLVAKNKELKTSIMNFKSKDKKKKQRIASLDYLDKLLKKKLKVHLKKAA